MKKILQILPLVVLILLQISCGSANNKTAGSSAGSTAVPSVKAAVADQGVRIDYTDTGKGDTVLLFVHGWAINKGYWSNQADAFSGRYRVIAVDLPGFGQSGKNRNDWTVKAFGRDLDSVMEQLQLKNVVLIGHSMSGDIILEAALHAPNRVIGLIGVDNFKGVGQPWTKESVVSFTKAIAALKKNFVPVATQWFNQELFYKTTDSAVRKRVLNDVAHTDSAIAIAAMEDTTYKEVENLSAVKKKLYLINSDVTPTDTTGFVAHHIPYEILYIHATGHYPMIEKPAEFNAALKQVITRL